MEVKKLLYYLIEALSWLCLIGAFIGLAYFVQDILHDFSSRKTNDRVFSERVTFYKHPDITICFEPQVNISVLKKYNLSLVNLGHINGIPLTNLSVSIDTFLENIRYKVGRDYTLKFSLSGHESNLGYVYAHFGYEEFPKQSYVEIEEIPLLMYYGTCIATRISSDVRGAIQMFNSIELNFKNTDTDGLPLINVYFTSEENVYGAFWLQWMEGEIFAINIDPKQNLDFSVNLKQQIRRKLPETSYCNENSGYYKCLAKK